MIPLCCLAQHPALCLFATILVGHRSCAQSLFSFFLCYSLLRVARRHQPARAFLAGAFLFSLSSPAHANYFQSGWSFRGFINGRLGRFSKLKVSRYALAPLFRSVLFPPSYLLLSLSLSLFLFGAIRV